MQDLIVLIRSRSRVRIGLTCEGSHSPDQGRVKQDLIVPGTGAWLGYGSDSDPGPALE